MNNGEVGARIRTARKRIPLTQRALAAAVGVAPSWMSMVENGHVKANLQRIEQIAHALDVHPASLLYDLPSPPELSPDEDALLAAYRALHPNHRPELVSIATRWASP